MKKAVLKIVLPVLAVGAVIGSGYAVWYFNGVTTKTADMTLEITNKVEAGKLEVKQGSNDYANDSRLVFDQAARDTATGHGTTGQGVKFVDKDTNVKVDTYADMTKIDVNYIGNGNTDGTAATLNFKEYVGVPKNVDAYIDFVDSGFVAATTTQLTADGVATDGLHNYYRYTLVTGADNADKTDVFTVVAATFKYTDAIKNDSTVAAYNSVHTAVQADITAGAPSVKFTFVANFKA